MQLLAQCFASLTYKKWIEAVVQERKVNMRYRKGISSSQQFTMGLLQGYPSPAVLFNTYTKELADLKTNGLSQVPTLTDDGLVNKTAMNTNTAVTALQEQLEKCHAGEKRHGQKLVRAKHKPCGASPITEEHDMRCWHSPSTEKTKNSRPASHTT